MSDEVLEQPVASSVDFDKEQWDLVIRPPKAHLDVNVKELWEYKYLLYQFIKRDFVAQFKQTILGPLWFIIQPLTTTGIYSIIFSGVAKLPTDGVPPPLFYLLGTTFWNFFSGVMTSNANVLGSNAGLFGKVYIPRLLPAISTTVSRLYQFGVQFILLLIVYVYYLILGAAIHPNLYLLLVPVVMLQHTTLALGFGLWISAWTVKYRDLQHLVGFGMSLWMWATPIVYPLSMVQGNELLKTFLWLNPVSAGLDLIRYAFTGAGAADFVWWAYGWAWSLGILLLGLFFFQKAEQTYVDVA